MKKIIFNPQRVKIISPYNFDKDIFFSKLTQTLNAQEIVTEGNISEFKLKHPILQVNYLVKIKVKSRCIKYSFALENIIMAIFFAMIAGALFYRGRFDTYFFWAFVIGILFLFFDIVTTRNLINNKIKEVLQQIGEPRKQKDVEPEKNCNWTRELRCPACGALLSGFESCCPGCEINLGNNSVSVTNYKNIRLKMFYTKRNK
ncbi:MAG: hypothetical protein IKQ46_15560 [Bacteroidales bacterium]|nr:hypothetical protein [Bacteroidales bacterium]